MKINEQPIFAPNQQHQNTPIDQSNFEHWINTPTKKNSGDEFYWQHQAQLQNSSVTFEEQRLSHYQNETVITRNERNDEISSLDLRPIDNQKPQSSSDYKKEPINNTTNAAFLKNVVSELIHELSQLPIPENHPISESKSINNLKSEATKPIEHKFNKGQFNNFHLFIQNEEAEVSLNTHDLDQKEQLKLKQLILLNLRHKGIYLKQLIINGVRND